MAASAPMGWSPAAICTGYLRATPSAGSIWRHWAPSPAKSRTSTTSRPPSRRSPIISRTASTFRRSWPRLGRPASGEQRSMRRQPSAQQQPTLEEAGEAVELQSPPDVGDSGPRPAVAEPWIRDQTLRVAAGSGQCQTERSRHCALRPTRIGRMVLAPVAQHDRESVTRPTVRGEHRRRGKKYAAERRRYGIENIVEARCRPSKGAVVRRTMADHAVERICHLVREEAGQAEQQVPEDRGDDTVAEIFSQAF